MPPPTRPAGDYVLVCDKPAGVTSHDVVAAVRRELPRRTKVGHAGTLDPFATGLLLVLVGRATRAQRFLMALEKRYEAVARFGAVSSTGDPAAPTCLLGGQGPRASRLRAGARGGGGGARRARGDGHALR
jgi:tRNA U55 pseudouridine synthase TruB